MATRSIVHIGAGSAVITPSRSAERSTAPWPCFQADEGADFDFLNGVERAATARRSQ